MAELLLHPAEHPEFEMPKHPERENLEIRRQKYEKTGASYEQAYRQRRMGNAEYGLAMGRMLMEEIASVALRNQPPENRANALSHIEAIHDYYRRILSSESDYLILRNGFISELGVAEALSYDAKPGFPVHFPEKDEDLKGKVDWWVDLEVDEPKNILAVQVKSLPFKEEPKEKVIPFSSERELYSRIVSPYGDVITNPKKFLTNGLTMLEYCQQYDNVQPVYILLPALGGIHSRINPETGQPDTRLGRELSGEIESKFPVGG